MAKGPKKGFIPKRKPCKKCGHEVAPNARICPNCLKDTGFVTSPPKEYKP